jgi:hypothetical protein
MLVGGWGKTLSLEKVKYLGTSTLGSTLLVSTMLAWGSERLAPQLRYGALIVLRSRVEKCQHPHRPLVA